MKFLSYFLILCIFFSFSVGQINSQVVESDYIRGEGLEMEVLGVEDELPEEVEEESEEERVEKSSTNQSPILDILAIAGGVVIVGLFAHMIFSKKRKGV